MLPAVLARLGFAGLGALGIAFWIHSTVDGDLLLRLIATPLLLLFIAVLLLVLGVDGLLTILNRRSWHRLGALLVILLALGPGSPGATALRWLGAAARVRAHEHEYEQLARRALESPEPIHEPLYAFRDEHDPQRAAIEWGGITDNWVGVVYDPTQTFEAADERAFGGRMIVNLHLWGPWYYVVFT